MGQSTIPTDDTKQADERPVFTREQQETLLDHVMSLSRTKSIRRNERVTAGIDVETGDIVWSGKLQRGSTALPPEGVQHIVWASADSCWVSRDMVAREMMRGARNTPNIRVE